MLHLLVPVAALSLFHNNFFADNPAPAPLSSPLGFPKWLADFTGMTLWPGIDPPYIPLDFVSLEGLQGTDWRHEQGDCPAANNRDEYCSFDCFNCVASDDVYTCPQLSQTFDDGPLPFTPQLTKSLGCKSTFFTIGMNVVRYPQVYADTASQGHIMGCHTWLHKFLPLLTNEEIVAQIEWTVWAMNATYGHLPKWFRPPYGGIDNRVRGIIRQFGMQLVLWDYDTFDWRLNVEPHRLDADVVAGVAKFAAERLLGLILEHDATQRTVNLGIQVHEHIGDNQLTVPQCVGGINYIKTFERLLAKAL